MKTLLILLSFLSFSVLSYAQASHPPLNGNVTLPTNGSTDRFQMPNLPSQTCTFVADTTNTGCIFLGGYTVTNASGSNKGIPLGGNGCASTTANNIQVYPNLNSIYFSTATNNNKVQYFCN